MTLADHILLFITFSYNNKQTSTFSETLYEKDI